MNTTSEPFEPEPREIGPGVFKPLAIGCGVLLILGVAGLILFQANMGLVLSRSFGLIEDQIEARLAEDLDPALREELKGAFGQAKERLAADQFDLETVSAVQRDLAGLTTTSELGEEEVRSLITSLGRLDPSAPEPETSPAVEAADPAEGQPEASVESFRESSPEPSPPVAAPNTGAAP